MELLCYILLSIAVCGLSGSGIGIYWFIKYFRKKEVIPIPLVGSMTLVFIDVSNSTSLWEKCGEAMDTSITTYYNILHKYSHQYEGREVNTEGDSMFLVFDDIVVALMWCIEVDNELLHTKWPEELTKEDGAQMLYNDKGQMVYNGLTVHIGIHVGEPICKYNKTTKNFDYYGPVVNKTARIQTIAKSGQICMSNLATLTLIDNLQRYSPNNIITNDVNEYEIILGNIYIKVTYIGLFSLKGILMPERLYTVTHNFGRNDYTLCSIPNSISSTCVENDYSVDIRKFYNKYGSSNIKQYDTRSFDSESTESIPKHNNFLEV
jgi:class 3 adenylate cyclase